MSFGFDVMRQNLRRRCPEASEDEIEHALSEWLADRPGAEFGDTVGRGNTVATDALTANEVIPS